jgi:hypothetical protein
MLGSGGFALFGRQAAAKKIDRSYLPNILHLAFLGA